MCVPQAYIPPSHTVTFYPIPHLFCERVGLSVFVSALLGFVLSDGSLIKIDVLEEVEMEIVFWMLNADQELSDTDG